uniref:Uncharacterized protein n=1 Tax=Siphoviridae sp. ctLqe90 TaxID=2825456 RepID=A0A8S5Q1Q0_9CAUD|nr:MAG TPA: hypothetical protein [Siphoviridae sp. ctLqe90]
MSSDYILLLFKIIGWTSILMLPLISCSRYGFFNLINFIFNNCFNVFLFIIRYN